MAFRNIRTLIRVDCTTILDPKKIAEKLRTIEGFDGLLGDYTSFKIGDTTNYKQGGVKTMSPDEMVYRYVKNAEGLLIRLDLTSQFYYVNLAGNNIPNDYKEYVDLIEKVTKTIMDNDVFVKITGYAIRKDFEDIKNPPSDSEIDNVNRKLYMSEPEQVQIVYIDREVKEKFTKTLIALKGEKKMRLHYDNDEKLFDAAFFSALDKAERDNGLI